MKNSVVLQSMSWIPIEEGLPSLGDVLGLIVPSVLNGGICTFQGFTLPGLCCNGIASDLHA